MKDLKKLTGAKAISKMEQKTIKGGIPRGTVCGPDDPVVVCYFPAHCEIMPDGSWGCV